MSTLVVSDVHLCGVVPDGGPWMLYRQRSQLADAELATLIDRVRGATIVCNGDFFDFDAPDLRKSGRDRSEAAAVSLIGAILDDHPLVVSALQKAARVVFIAGNHDAQLAYPSVQNVIRSRVNGASVFCDFYTTPDGFHIEHGHQYDPMCSNNGPEDDSIGTVVTYYTPLIFGCASPYASDPLNTDWVAGLCGCASTELTMAFLRDLLMVRAALRESAGDYGALTIERLRAALFARKTLANEVIEQRAWNNYGPEACRRLRVAADRLSGMFGGRGVVMGHTHVPIHGPTYFNSGSWVGDALSFVWIEDGRAETRYWRQ